MNDRGYMDAAAVPVPDAGDDAFALNLHGELANHRLTTPVQCACGWREPDTEDRTWSRHVRDALLPRIREHVAAAVQAERERIGDRLDAEAAEADESATEREELYKRAGDQIAAIIFRASASIAREEPDDG